MSIVSLPTIRRAAASPTQSPRHFAKATATVRSFCQTARREPTAPKARAENRQRLLARAESREPLLARAENENRLLNSQSASNAPTTAPARRHRHRSSSRSTAPAAPAPSATDSAPSWNTMKRSSSRTRNARSRTERSIPGRCRGTTTSGARLRSSRSARRSQWTNPGARCPRRRATGSCVRASAVTKEFSRSSRISRRSVTSNTSASSCGGTSRPRCVPVAGARSCSRMPSRCASPA